MNTETKTDNQNLDELKRKAKNLYYSGFKLAFIAEELKINPNTLYSWKNRENWDEVDNLSRITLSLENRICFLINKNDKSDREFNEIDALMKQFEKTERLKKYAKPSGKEKDLNPRLKNRGRKKGQKESNAISEEQEDLLKASFLGEMFNYQKYWWEAGKKFRVRNILKSRQIGATYYFAHEALVDALQTGRNQIFLSASKKQALMFRSYIVAYAKKVADVELKGETITLPNGAELIFLGTNAATAQSYHGNLYFDEIFWVRNFGEMRKVAAAMASQKQYRQTYFSTPSSKAHSAFDFWSGKTFNRGRAKSEQIEFDISHENLSRGKLLGDGQWRQIVNILDAEKGGCTLFDIEALKLENSPDEFQQLFMCEFADDEKTAFRFTELQGCAVDSLEEWRDYKPFEQLRPFGRRPVWLGYDPAYTGDRAALAIVAPPAKEGGIYRVLHVQTYHGEDYEKQALIIRDYCDSYNVEKIAIDASGMGSGVFQEVKKFRPDAVGLVYSADLKNEMVLKTKNLIQKNRLQFDGGENDIITSFLTIKKQATRSGAKMTYASDRSVEASHGDIAWAIMNCILNVQYGESSGLNASAFFTFD